MHLAYNIVFALIIYQQDEKWLLFFHTSSLVMTLQHAP